MTDRDDSPERELKRKTAETAQKYFNRYPWDRPYELWRSFDPALAKDLSLFITGKMYARQKLPHPTRQMVAIAALAALGHAEELRLHLWAALEVGVGAEELAEAIFQVGTYAGMPRVNQALTTLREVLDAHQSQPPPRR